MCNALLVQRGASTSSAAVFTLLMSSNYVVLGIGMIACRAAHGRAWPENGLAIAGGLSAVAALVGLLLARGVATGVRPAEASAAELEAVERPGLRLPAWPGASGRRSAYSSGVRSGDRRALARAISLVEDSDPLAYDLVRELLPGHGTGVCARTTGPPGGKVQPDQRFVRHVRGAELTVGVISVDPRAPSRKARSSATCIRLSDHFLDPGVFIRSMGTRGHLGGLAEATSGAPGA